jgi:hypothetical protein
MLKSRDDMRKYKDAVMQGAKVAGQQLPTSFYVEMDKFLQAYKHEIAQGKKRGMVEDVSSDPINTTLYGLLMLWAIESNNVFVWAWTALQWNFIGRPSSINPLGFRNFSLRSDSIIGKYDDSKADKAGERLTEKNLYANPFDWLKCPRTAIGIWCALEALALAEHERLFLSPKAQEGAASKQYCEQIAGIAQEHMEEISNNMSYSKFNPYSFRKGAATHAVSGTTAPPSMPSVARRGEWSTGSVLDVHWHFASVGDHYLGHILAGLDASEATFAILPPH